MVALCDDFTHSETWRFVGPDKDRGTVLGNLVKGSLASPARALAPSVVWNWRVVMTTEQAGPTTLRTPPLRAHIEQYDTHDGAEFLAYLDGLDGLTGYGETIEDALEDLADMVVHDLNQLRQPGIKLSRDAEARRDTLCAMFRC